VYWGADLVRRLPNAWRGSSGPEAAADRLSDMRALAILPAVIVIATACEQPTAAEFARRSNELERRLLQESDDPASAWSIFGVNDLLESMPLMGWVEVRLDGKRRRYHAFVLERTVVRNDDDRDPPCPRTTRALVAGEGKAGVMLLAADGATEVSAPRMCGVPNPAPGGTAPVHRGAASVLVMASPGHSMHGRRGTVDVRTAGVLDEPCEFLSLRDDANEPLLVTCELARYVVRAEVELGLPSYAPAHRTGPARLRIEHQEVPGLRLTIHCPDGEESVGGCEP